MTEQEIERASNSTRSERIKRVIEYLCRENYRLENSRNEYKKELHNLIAENKKMQCCENCKHKQCGMKEIYKEVKQKDKTKTCGEWDLDK